MPPFAGCEMRLGDSADVPRFVETLPRRGYRFIAPVSRQQDLGKAEPLAPEIADEAIPTPDITAAQRPIRTVGSDVNRRHGRSARGRSLGIGFFPNVSRASIAFRHPTASCWRCFPSRT